MAEPTIKARLILLNAPISEDDGLSKQERKSLDIEEFKANKALQSKKFIQTALGKVVNFFYKIMAWYVGIKTFFKKIPNFIRKAIPSLGRFIKGLGNTIKVGFGPVFQFVATINPAFIIDWMDKLGISIGGMGNLSEGSQKTSISFKELSMSFDGISKDYAKDTSQTIKDLDTFGRGVTMFSGTLDAQPVVEALKGLEGAIDSVDGKIAQLQKLKEEIEEMKSQESSRSTPKPFRRTTTLARKVVRNIDRMNNPLSSKPIYRA